MNIFVRKTCCLLYCFKHLSYNYNALKNEPLNFITKIIAYDDIQLNTRIFPFIEMFATCKLQASLALILSVYKSI